MKYRLIFILFFSFLAVQCTAAATISLEDGSISTGGSTTLILSLDEAPTGFAGYFLNVSVNSQYVGIANVEYPAWATMHQTVGLGTGSDIRLKTIDLLKTVGPGATDIELARITFTGLKEGTSTVVLYDELISDDNGDPINPALPVSTIVVYSTTSGSSGASGASGAAAGRSPSYDWTIVTPAPAINEKAIKDEDNYDTPVVAAPDESELSTSEEAGNNPGSSGEGSSGGSVFLNSLFSMPPVYLAAVSGIIGISVVSTVAVRGYLRKNKYPDWWFEEK
ncbi:MAG: hypothetical protein JW931_05445 [Methanomicrobiaceae archaeon]|nr:hypothetical protein [Methanomicrobiaceae archaeon]